MLSQATQPACVPYWGQLCLSLQPALGCQKHICLATLIGGPIRFACWYLTSLPILQQGAGDGGVKSEQTSQHPRFSLLDGAYHAHGHLTCLDNGVEAEGMQVADQGISTALARRADQALQLTGTGVCTA